jgi:hypothetical protein
VVLVVGSIVTYIYLEEKVAPTSMTLSPLLTNGAHSDYAYGSSLASGFNLTAPRSLLSGAFTTNTSLVLYVMTSSDYQKRSPGSLNPAWWYYTTGDARAANVSVSLYEGSWYLLFVFVNDTGRVVHTANGTGIASETHLAITQTFTVTPEGAQAENSLLPVGLSNLDLAGRPDSNVAGRLAVNMSSPGYLVLEVDRETFSAGVGNLSDSQPVTSISPLWVSFTTQVGTSNYTFSAVPQWNGSGDLPGPRTGPIGFSEGLFPDDVVFTPAFTISSGAPGGHYLLILTVLCYPLDLEGTPGYRGPPALATFSIDVVVS